VKRVALAVAVALAATAGRGGAEPATVRLCADPLNPPFSARDQGEPGFEVEIARAIAATLGAELGVHWFPAVRETAALRQLYEGRCDLFMGLPVAERFRDGKPRLGFSRPYYVMRQVIVSPAVGGVASPQDLAGKLVGVQAMTLGDSLVFERGHRRRVYLTPAETFGALVNGEVDAVVIESPLAGWFVKTTPGFRAVDAGDRARDLDIGLAVRREDGQLRAAIDGALAQLSSAAVPDILARYGIVLAQNAPAAPSPELREARSTYLTQCSQCHGPDASGTAAAANLRAFKGSEEDFLRIVRNGRPGTAMTPWKGLIPDDDIRGIARYIKQLGSEAPR
jgi:ABC-type amino acid transport substrate-binding protein